MALCMVCSAVARIVFVGMKGIDTTLEVWSQIVLPIAAALLFALITLVNGKDHFYKSAIPVWLICLYYYFVFSGFQFGSFHTMIIALYAIALLFVGIQCIMEEYAINNPTALKNFYEGIISGNVDAFCAGCEQALYNTLYS